MKKLLLLFLLIPSLCFADNTATSYTYPPLEVTTSSLSPDTYPYRLVFPDGSLTTTATGTVVTFPSSSGGTVQSLSQGSGISLNPNPITTSGIIALGSFSIDAANDVDTTTTPPVRDKVLKWNGTQWVPAVYNDTFAMTIASFSSGQSSPQLIGSGTWKTTGNLSFIASYNNPPPASASIDVSGTGVTWGSVLTLTTPFTSGSSAENTAYPSAKDTTTTFTLTAYDGATPRTATSAVTFYNYIFYGNSTTGSSFTEANVEALSSSLSNSYTTSRTINAGVNDYLVIAYPSNYTSIDTNGFIFNSITCPFNAPETVAVTNTAGFTENYKVFASVSKNLGNSTLQLSTSSSLIDPIYYGVSTVASSYSEADVEGLANSVISNTKGRTFNITPGALEYIIYALPVRLGTVTFTVGGFLGGFQAPETVAITNVNGYAENYYVYRSTNVNLGLVTVVVN